MKTSLAANGFPFLCALGDSAREFLWACLDWGRRFRKPVDDACDSVLHPFQPKVQNQPKSQLSLGTMVRKASRRAAERAEKSK